MPYYPSFNRYPPETVNRLMRITAAQTLIDGARILPAQEDELRRKALVGTIHYSTLIEGNELPVIEAERAVKGELEPTTKAKRELVNYVRALEWLDAHFADGEIVYTPEFILDLHRLLMYDLGVPGAMFEPRHEGKWRDGVAVVGDRVSGVVYHEAPSAGEVPSLIDQLCDYLESKRVQGTEYPGPILAGVAHYRLTDIHPFADGNGRLARLFTVAVLFREGYVSRRLFSAERYYAMDKDAYFDALRSVSRNSNNMDEWLLYFTDGLAQEFERVGERVQELNGLSERLAQTTQLTPNQEKAVATLTTGGRSEISRADYEELTNVRRSQASEDLAGLVKARILKQVGSGPTTRYRLALFVKTQAGRKRGPALGWTDARIEGELRNFVGQRHDWPPPSEFRRAGKMPLYQAASRRGGIAHWIKLLGLES